MVVRGDYMMINQTATCAQSILTCILTSIYSGPFMPGKCLDSHEGST